MSAVIDGIFDVVAEVIDNPKIKDKSNALVPLFKQYMALMVVNRKSFDEIMDGWNNRLAEIAKARGFVLNTKH